MRGKHPAGGLLGFTMIAAGVIILFARVLPSGFWWFLLGAGLIFCGCCCVNRH